MHRTAWTDFADAAITSAVIDRRSDPAGQPVPTAANDAAPTDPDAAAQALDEARQGLHAELAEATTPFAALCANAELSVDESEALALLAAVDLDVRRQRLMGWLQDDLARLRPGLDLLGRLLAPPHAGALTVAPRSGLIRAALVEVADHGPWGAREIGVAPSVVWALNGDLSPDPGLPEGTHFEETDVDGTEALVFVTGPDRVKRRHEAVRASLADRFVVCDQPATDEAWRAVVREATIRGAGVVIECRGDLDAAGRAAIEAADHLPWGVTSEFEVSVASLPDRPWGERHVSGRDAEAEEWHRLVGAGASAEHRLTSEQLVTVAKLRANLQDPDDPAGVERAVRRLASGPIDRLSRRIRPRYQWTDLVLDEEREEQLREVLARYRNARQVYDQWGFPAVPSGGLITLFSGDPGTGKTMSAEVIAGELGLDLFVVDLAAVVSKYIGETEKNLDEVFDAAAVGNQVLFFDEADSLFGKRTEVSDARDRYANLEVSYLLQRLEIFEGLVVLATNLSNNIDPAFLRRIDVSIDFVPPEVPERTRLWERSFPPGAPMADDVDVTELAKTYELTGGSIRKAALYAGFLAAEADDDITRARIGLAVDREYQKLGRLRPSRRIGAPSGRGDR